MKTYKKLISVQHEKLITEHYRKRVNTYNCGEVVSNA